MWVPHFPRFGPRASPHGPRASPPRSPAPPPTVPLDTHDGPARFPQVALDHRPARRRRLLPKGNDNGRTENDKQQTLAGRRRPAAGALTRIIRGQQRTHGYALHKRGGRDARDEYPRLPSCDHGTHAFPPVSRGPEIARRDARSRRLLERLAMPLHPNWSAGPSRLPIRSEVGILGDFRAPA